MLERMSVLASGKKLRGRQPPRERENLRLRHDVHHFSQPRPAPPADPLGEAAFEIWLCPHELGPGTVWTYKSDVIVHNKKVYYWIIWKLFLEIK